MINFMGSKKKLNEVDKCVDPQLWHACAGGMVQMPPVNAKVCYFPQGHAENARGPVDFGTYPKIPPLIQCRVAAIKYMADPDTDEVYAKLRLVPLNSDEADFDDGGVGVGVGGLHGSETEDKPPSFAKALTQSDANNGSGFSVPRYCAETIFPRLDYSEDRPLQIILVKDVHGRTWKFRHIYRGTPKRHLLTTGWSNFVNHKKLVAGDFVVFLRAEDGDLCIGIRRARIGVGGGPEASSGWSSVGGIHHVPYGGFGAFLREGDNQLMRNGNCNGNGFSTGASAMGKGKVRAEAVVEAATRAANKQPFEVLYYPLAGTPEFCVRASLVRAASQIRWCPGMRFKMPFEHDDSSRISMSMGTITSVQVADPRWPDSPWRLLQVTWDEPELLKNVTRVSPWQIKLVSSMPALNLPPFSPPQKKLRLSQRQDFPLDGQLPMPTFPTSLLGPSNPFLCLPESTPAGMQGARHAHYGISLSDLPRNKLPFGLFPASFAPIDHAATPMKVTNKPTLPKPSTSGNVSCLLSMSISPQSSKKLDDAKAPQLVLFGQRILTEQQISLSSSADRVSPILNGYSSSHGTTHKMTNLSYGSGSAFHRHGIPELSSCERLLWYKNHGQDDVVSLETSRCKVFVESEDVGRTIDLSLLGSYDELCRKLANMFSMQVSKVLSHALYSDTRGEVKRIGDEPFSDFAKTARRLTILMDSSYNDNNGGV